MREATTSYCIFQEPWWLEAVAPGAWRSLEVSRKTEGLVARMPIVLRRLYGFTFVRQPPLTPTLGPWTKSAVKSPSKQLSEQKALFNELIDQIPECDYFEACFNHRITNWLPFYWRGFAQTTRYTYILDNISDTGKVWLGLQESVRRHVRHAEQRLAIRTDLPVDRLLDLVELTFSRQGRNLPFRRDVVHRIDAACAAYDARRMYFAQDAEGQVHAALYCVRDAEYMYYLLGGGDPQLRSSGAQSLLFWRAITEASEMGLKFDFEGSMIESIERVFRAFGAVQVPYMQVYRGKPLLMALLQTLPRGLLRDLVATA